LRPFNAALDLVTPAIWALSAAACNNVSERRAGTGTVRSALLAFLEKPRAFRCMFNTAQTSGDGEATAYVEQIVHKHGGLKAARIAKKRHYRIALNKGAGFLSSNVSAGRPIT
jgi:hypothetical protein